MLGQTRQVGETQVKLASFLLLRVFQNFLGTHLDSLSILSVQATWPTLGAGRTGPELCRIPNRGNKRNPDGASAAQVARLCCTGLLTCPHHLLFRYAMTFDIS